jgi:hypothetical protein
MLIFKLPLEDVLSHPDLAKRYCLLGSVQLQTSESKALPSMYVSGGTAWHGFNKLCDRGEIHFQG